MKGGTHPSHFAVLSILDSNCWVDRDFQPSKPSLSETFCTIPNKIFMHADFKIHFSPQCFTYFFILYVNIKKG